MTNIIPANLAENATVSMWDTFGLTTAAALDTHERLVVVLADIGTWYFSEAAERHPDRVINVGIREQLMMGVAGGLALTGLRPVVHTVGSFLIERPFEQIKLDFGHQDVGAILVSYGASYDITEQGRTHYAPGDVALIDTLPGWTVHVPGHPDEVDRLLLAAFSGNDRVYLRLSDQSNARAHGTTGSFQVLKQGRSGVVVAVGPVLDRVLEATSMTDVTVLYTPTIRPFDRAGLRAAVLAADESDVVLVEPYLAGTSAHRVAEALVDVPHRLRALGVERDREVRAFGRPADHDVAHGLDVAGIAAAIHAFLR